MSRDAENALVGALAAYGLLKLLEEWLCPPRPVIVVVQGEAAAQFLELLDAPEEGE